MAKPIIEVEKLSKRYHVGTNGRATIGESLNRWGARLMGRAEKHRKEDGGQNKIFEFDRFQAGPSPNTFWALRDISFSVEEGQIVGIIGQNGAGKSTLLKILSRITAPTSGHAVLRGRVSSLLEIGTGFHPDLTGRENVFLNGAVLGMRKREIKRRFDEIAAFAEVEKFIDTPVKYYSSGMYARLAFSVAAHLEPEILLVDEVLAVGDANFQKKCLGKMEAITKQDRTILFVSHNMQAIQSLCSTAFHMERGRLLAFGSPKEIISKYLSGMAKMNYESSWSEEAAPGNEEIKLIGIRVFSEEHNATGVYGSSTDIYLEMRFMVNLVLSASCIGFDLVSAQGEVVMRSYHTDLSPDEWPQMHLGENVWTCLIPKGLLNAGVYYVCPRIGLHNMYWIVKQEATIQFEIVLNHGISPFWNCLDSQSRPGVIAPILKWESSR